MINELYKEITNRDFADEPMEFSNVEVTQLGLTLSTLINSRIWALNLEDSTKYQMVRNASTELKELILKWTDVDIHDLKEINNARRV